MVEKERAIKFRTLESRQSSEAAVFYYEKAVEALKTVGMFAAEFAVEFVTPGGVENLRKHARGEISDAEYVFNIANDHARDAVITAIGAHFGGSAGGFAGYVYSRAATAAGRTFARTTEFKGNAAARVQKCRVQRTYGQGKFWEDKLISQSQSKTASGLSAKNRDKIFALIQEAKRKFKGEIKADIDGNLYKFDPSHQTNKVHLEKIVKRSDGFHGTGEIDPETGAILKTFDRFLGK